MFLDFLKKRQVIIKFLISGGISTFVDLLALYLFAERLGMWYVEAAVFAFAIAFVVSFSLQKFWTFNGKHIRRKREQIPIYLLINLINLLINTAGMYVFVDVFKIWYLLAQVVMAGLIAVCSFFIYRLVVFKEAEVVAVKEIEQV